MFVCFLRRNKICLFVLFVFNWISVVQVTLTTILDAFLYTSLGVDAPVAVCSE